MLKVRPVTAVIIVYTIPVFSDILGHNKILAKELPRPNTTMAVTKLRSLFIRHSPNLSQLAVIVPMTGEQTFSSKSLRN